MDSRLRGNDGTGDLSDLLLAGTLKAKVIGQSVRGIEAFFMENELTKGKNMGILWLVLIVVLWVALQAYILPKLGIST
jgi:hypothetical protein